MSAYFKKLSDIPGRISSYFNSIKSRRIWNLSTLVTAFRHDNRCGNIQVSLIKMKFLWNSIITSQFNTDKMHYFCIYKWISVRKWMFFTITFNILLVYQVKSCEFAGPLIYSFVSESFFKTIGLKEGPDTAVFYPSKIKLNQLKLVNCIFNKILEFSRSTAFRKSQFLSN